MDDKDIKTINTIYNHINSVLSYCQDCKTLIEFQSDSMKVEACVFNLMQIGELAKTSLSEEAKNQMSSIPWKQIYGLRNRIVHEYFGVDMSMIWAVITEDLQPLKQEIEKFSCKKTANNL